MLTHCQDSRAAAEPATANTRVTFNFSRISLCPVMTQSVRIHYPHSLFSVHMCVLPILQCFCLDHHGWWLDTLSLWKNDMTFNSMYIILLDFWCLEYQHLLLVTFRVILTTPILFLVLSVNLVMSCLVLVSTWMKYTYL